MGAAWDGKRVEDHAIVLLPQCLIYMQEEERKRKNENKTRKERFVVDLCPLSYKKNGRR